MMNNLIKSKLKQFDELYDNIPLTKREYNRWRTKVIRLGELIWFHFDRNDLWDSFDDILEFKKRYSPYYIKHHLKTLHKVDYNPE